MSGQKIVTHFPVTSFSVNNDKTQIGFFPKPFSSPGQRQVKRRINNHSSLNKGQDNMPQPHAVLALLSLLNTQSPTIV